MIDEKERHWKKLKKKKQANIIYILKVLKVCQDIPTTIRHRYINTVNAPKAHRTRRSQTHTHVHTLLCLTRSSVQVLLFKTANIWRSLTTMFSEKLWTIRLNCISKTIPLTKCKAKISENHKTLH